MSFKPIQDTYFVTRTVMGIPVKFAIEETWDYDDRAVEDAYDDYLALFETGELIHAVIQVKAHALGITGEDFLSGCHVKGARLESDLNEMINYQCMVDNAIDAWVEILMRQIETLKPFFNKGE